MLNWDESSTNWYEDTFPKLKENSLLLLFGGDIEIMNSMESQSEIEEILNREKIDINEKFRLVPFAKKMVPEIYFVFNLICKMAKIFLFHIFRMTMRCCRF